MRIITCYFIVALITFYSIADSNQCRAEKKEHIMSYNVQDTKFLENAEGDEALQWAKQRTDRTKELLKSTISYELVKKHIESIAYDKQKTLWGRIYRGYVYNFWSDDNNPQGLWRRVSVAEYATEQPQWEVLIDFDKLSQKMGQKVVFHGARRCFKNHNLHLVHMSFGGKDETFFIEWDLAKKDFVDNGFACKGSDGKLLEGKFTYGIWIDQDTIICNIVLKKDDVTQSLYPNSLYIWKRGQAIEQATKIFDIPKEYVLLSASKLLSHTISPSLFYISALEDFDNSHNYILDEDLQLKSVHIPSDATVTGSFKEHIFLLLRSDWKVGSKDIKAGSLVAMHWTDLLKADEYKSSLQVLFVPTAREVFGGISTTRDTVFLVTYKNVTSQVVTFTLQDGQWTIPTPLSLPYAYSIFSISANEDEQEALVTIENAIVPPTIYLWNQNHNLTVIRKPLYHFNSEEYAFEQREAISTDGVKIPYFITYKKGMKFNGKNPTLLNAYGGFQVINTPRFNRLQNEIWVKNGGVSVLANIRGGGEFGVEWHKAAQGMKRQTGFDDFIAVAQDLIDHNVTSPNHLGIIGGSNGGLLVSVAMTQRPDLFGAVVCNVPILDMVRYTEFGAGHSWISEYGDPANPEMLSYLKKYAPLENISLTRKYPAVLITGSALDQRVHPWHARIFQYILEKNAHAKVYFLESNDGGHGGGCNLTDSVDYYSNIYTFLAETLRLKFN